MVRASGEWTRGRAGEDFVRRWLKEQGYYVVPTGMIERGGAPLLESHLRSEILPDLQVSRGGATRWVEVKTKSRATKNRIRDRWEHGLEQRHWNSYLRVVEETGIRGCLAVLETGLRRLLVGNFEDIDLTSARWDGGGDNRRYQEPMIYFDVRRFDWFQVGAAEILPAAVSPKTIRPWEVEQPADRQLPLPLF